MLLPALSPLALGSTLTAQGGPSGSVYRTVAGASDVGVSHRGSKLRLQLAFGAPLEANRRSWLSPGRNILELGRRRLGCTARGSESYKFAL